MELNFPEVSSDVWMFMKKLAKQILTKPGNHLQAG